MTTTVEIDNDSHVTDDNEPRVSVLFDEETYCRHCDAELYVDRVDIDGLKECPGHEDFDAEGDAIQGPHEPYSGPQQWAHGAGVTVKEDDDSIEVWIT